MLWTRKGRDGAVTRREAPTTFGTANTQISDRHCERSEAISCRLHSPDGDCFVAPLLAMTTLHRHEAPKIPSRPSRILRVQSVVFFLLTASLHHCEITISRVAADLLPGRGTGDLAEHRAGYQPRAAGVVVIEQPADQLPGRIQTGNRLLRGVEHPPVGVDAHPAKGEGDAAGRAVRLVGRLFQRHRP